MFSTVWVVGVYSDCGVNIRRHWQALVLLHMSVYWFDWEQQVGMHVGTSGEQGHVTLQDLAARRLTNRHCITEFAQKHLRRRTWGNTETWACQSHHMWVSKQTCSVDKQSAFQQRGQQKTNIYVALTAGGTSCSPKLHGFSLRLLFHLWWKFFRNFSRKTKQSKFPSSNFDHF